MDSAKSGQQSSLDSLRTVEFRQTLRGYHIDDVDEYLERVAVEAEALQEQLRQSNERLRQAADRIAQLERMLADTRDQTEREPEHAVVAHEPTVSDDTLQRTLLLAQKFVDQTKAEAESQARATLAKAEEHARSVLSEAETKARSVTADTERKLREEVGRLETRRLQLTEDLEKVAEHFESERNRLRAALGEMMAWVDKTLQPDPSRDRQSEEGPTAASGQPTNGGNPGHQHQMPSDRDRGSAPAGAPTGGMH